MTSYKWGIFSAAVLSALAMTSGAAVPFTAVGLSVGFAAMSFASGAVLPTTGAVSKAEYCQSAKNTLQIMFSHLMQQSDVTNECITNYLNEKCNDKKVLNRFENHFDKLSEDGENMLAQFLQFDEDPIIRSNPLFGVQQELGKDAPLLTPQEIRDFDTIQKLIPMQFRKAANNAYISATAQIADAQFNLNSAKIARSKISDAQIRKNYKEFRPIL